MKKLGIGMIGFGGVARVVVAALPTALVYTFLGRNFLCADCWQAP